MKVLFYNSLIGLSLFTMMDPSVKAGEICFGDSFSPNISYEDLMGGRPLKCNCGARFKGEIEKKDVCLPGNIDSIPARYFACCPHLNEVTFEAGATIRSFAERAFYRSGITSITIPNSVEYISYECFANCEDLQNIAFEAGSKLRHLGIRAFPDNEAGSKAQEEANSIISKNLEEA